MDDDWLKSRAFAVIDTNVIVAAMLTKTGMSAKVLSYVDQGNIVPLYDPRTIAEYKRVLNYGKLHFRDAARGQALAIVVDNGILVTDVRETARQFIDKDDVPFFEIKVGAEDDLEPCSATDDNSPIDDSHVIAPNIMVLVMRQLNSFVKKGWYRPRDVTGAVHALLDGNPEHVPGKKCAESFGLATKRAMDAPETGKDEAQGQGWSR